MNWLLEEYMFLNKNPRNMAREPSSSINIQILFRQVLKPGIGDVSFIQHTIRRHPFEQGDYVWLYLCFQKNNSLATFWKSREGNCISGRMIPA